MSFHFDKQFGNYLPDDPKYHTEDVSEGITITAIVSFDEKGEAVDFEEEKTEWDSKDGEEFSNYEESAISFFESIFNTSGHTVLVDDNKDIYELIRDYIKEETGKDLPVGVPYKMEVSVGLILGGEMIVYDDEEKTPSDDFGFSPSCLCSAGICDQETPEL